MSGTCHEGDKRSPEFTGQLGSGAFEYLDGSDQAWIHGQESAQGLYRSPRCTFRSKEIRALVNPLRAVDECRREEDAESSESVAVPPQGNPETTLKSDTTLVQPRHSRSNRDT